jgi:hypothetical protein
MPPGSGGFYPTPDRLGMPSRNFEDGRRRNQDGGRQTEGRFARDYDRGLPLEGGRARKGSSGQACLG